MSSPHHNNHNPNHAADSFVGLPDPWPFLQESTIDLAGLEYGSLDSSIFLDVPLMADLSILQGQGSGQPEDINQYDLGGLGEYGSLDSSMFVDVPLMADLSILQVPEGHDHAPRSMAEAEEPGTSGRTKKKKNQKLKGLEGREEDEVELDRNAKERARRIKIQASYLGLGALLPDSRRSKKWSAPIIVDKVVDYIPELEKEIQKLTLKKENMLAAMGNDEISDERARAHDRDEAPTVTVHPVNKREMIVQICTKRKREREEDPCSLSSIMHKMEEQGMSIVDASSASLCDDGVCTFHLHIQMDGRSDGGGEYNAEVVREKVISWLAT